MGAEKSSTEKVAYEKDTAVLESGSTSSTDISIAEGKARAAFNTANGKHVYEDDDFAKYYQPIDEYEGKHRFDPHLKWTAEEEAALVKRIDWRICAWCCLMFFALQLDRGNIGQALADNMLSDLGLTTNDYNTGQTIFLVSFLSAELPSQLISKWIGPDNWIPIQMVSWSIVAICQCRINSRATFFATRCLLGLIEGGFIPDVILYLSYFYKTAELPVRLSYFWTSYNLTGIVSGFLAFGILRLRGVNGWEGWRWLFALEGALTALIGVISYFYLPPSPTQTASYFRGKEGWFTEREETIMVTRILRDDPSKGDMHNRQHISLKMFWEALSDYDMWPIYLIGLCWLIPSNPPQAYLTLTLRALGFSTYKTVLLSIPASVMFIFQLILWTRVSEIVNKRLIFGVANALYLFPLLFVLRFVDLETKAWAKFAVITCIVGHIYVHAILVAMTSRNAGSVRTRTVGSALYNMFVQASSIIGANIYRENDKPRYKRGNSALLIVNGFVILVFFGAIFYYKHRNATRDKIWDAMTDEEKKEYLRTTKDEGNKRLDFRFIY